LPPQVGKTGTGPGPIVTNPNQGVEQTKSQGAEKKPTQTPIDTPKNEAAPQQKTAKDAATKKGDLSTQGSLQKTALQNQLKQTVIQGTSGDDIIHVSRGKGKYEVEVNINGSKRMLTKEESKNLVIDAGAGNDLVVVDDDVSKNILVKGGRGDDVIIDNRSEPMIQGGRGNDYLLDRHGRVIDDDPANQITGGSGNTNIDDQGK
jgi:Ca2+-binding RTX toxin-like protein